MNTSLLRRLPAADLVAARGRAHRTILEAPGEPGSLVLAAFVCELADELDRRRASYLDCPFCRAEVDAARGADPA